MRALMAGPQERRTPHVCLCVFLQDCRVRGPYSVVLQHSGGKTPSGG